MATLLFIENSFVNFEGSFMNSFTNSEKVGKGSYILMLRYDNAVGTLELSTDYSWDSAMESLSACTQKGVFNLLQMEELTYCLK